jgi:GNAT superfamily N-acetyltransferase
MEDNKALQKYIKDICTSSCNLKYKMEPDKYLIVIQDQLVCTLIVDLYVAPEYRRQGIATKLISEIEGPIKLECFDKNPARNLYLKLGFEPQDWKTAKNCHWYLKNDIK